MRISTAAFQKRVTQNLARLEERMGTLSNQIGSGRRVLKPSDDPRSVSVINWAHDELGANDTRQRLAGDGLTILNTSDAALGEMTDLLGRVVEVAQRALRPGTTDTARESSAADIRSAASEIIMLANTRVGNRYIYGGYQDRTPPITGEPDSATYGGDSNPISVPLGSGRSCDVSVTGDELLNFVRPDGTRAVPGVDADVFGALTALADALDSGDDATAKTWTDNASLLRERVLRVRGDMGAAQQRLEAHSSTLDDTELRLNQLLTDRESTDLAAAITEYSAQETDYKALIAVVGRVASLPTLFSTMN